MQVEHFLEQSARRWPHKVALVDGQRRVSYAEMDRLASGVARGLRAAGARRGDRVAVYLENSLEAVGSIFGILKAGCVFLVLNPTTKADKLAFVLGNSRAVAIVTDGRRQDTVVDLATRLPHLRSVVVVSPQTTLSARPGLQCLSFEELVQADGTIRDSGCIDIDLAALIYTSGSSGQPKGVMLTHLNIVSAATSITSYLENTEDDVILNVLPLSFDYGLYQVLMAFKIGGTVVLERSFAYPPVVLQRIAAEQVTGFPIVPTISAILLQMELERYDLSSLRYITNTGAMLPTRHIVELRRRLPHVKIFSMYGLTECKRVSYLPPDQIDVRPSSVGRGMPNEEVYIVDDQGNRLDAGVGELVVRGSHVMKGYWEMPEETDKVLKPGPLPGERVLYTGDLFRVDEEGYLYFVGRKDDIIKTRGEKVSPKEVENVLYALDGIAEAAVIGVPDPILGEAVKAVVALRDGAAVTEQDVLRHCSRHLEDFMVPKHVEIRETLPKTHSGKIARQELKRPAGAEAAVRP